MCDFKRFSLGESMSLAAFVNLLDTQNRVSLVLLYPIFKLRPYCFPPMIFWIGKYCTSQSTRISENRCFLYPSFKCMTSFNLSHNNLLPSSLSWQLKLLDFLNCSVAVTITASLKFIIMLQLIMFLSSCPFNCLVVKLVLLTVTTVFYGWMFWAARTTQMAVSSGRRRFESSIAWRMFLLVATNAACLVPIIVLGMYSLMGYSVHPQVTLLSLPSYTNLPSLIQRESD